MALIKEQVYLRVYDISDGIAASWSLLLLGKRLDGVWHTGLEIYGMEYFYGGGILKMRPQDVELSYRIRPVKVHHLGQSSVTQKEFEKYLISIQSSFNRNCYDLVSWNCNNFTDHASRFLLNRGIPEYILDLPVEITDTFMGKMIVNFIKMFSDAPAIDSEAATHPRHRLNSGATRFRRNSCPASPLNAAKSRYHQNRVLTDREEYNLSLLRQERREASTNNNDSTNNNNNNNNNPSNTAVASAQVSTTGKRGRRGSTGAMLERSWSSRLRAESTTTAAPSSTKVDEIIKSQEKELKQTTASGGGGAVPILNFPNSSSIISTSVTGVTDENKYTYRGQPLISTARRRGSLPPKGTKVRVCGTSGLPEPESHAGTRRESKVSR